MITAQYKCNIIISSPVLSAQPGQKQKLWRDQIKENRLFSPCEWKVSILKIRRFFCLLRLSLPPEMGEMAQTFISEIEWLAVLKCRATGLSTSWRVFDVRHLNCYMQKYIFKGERPTVIRRSWFPFHLGLWNFHSKDRTRRSFTYTR